MANQLPQRRCAIYTRKSSEEGLDQAYNSLAAQRDACASYVTSQKHEGWVLVQKAYDDGGFSGGNLQRPALQKLMQDMALGAIDIIIVYKIDRLTRSLADFAKLTDVLDKHQVSFVAVTQQFNTSTSMGRLTLNVLLSFAQFEREVAGERIRDKIAASKKRGMWMGGHPPLGYDVKNRKLEINEPEAETLRYIFRRYLALRSVTELQKDLTQAGVVSRRNVRADGSVQGGNPFSRGALYTILKNPIYRGLIAHKDNTYKGEHQAIVEKELFQDVQQALSQMGPGEAARMKRASPALLKGLIFDSTGDRIQPTHCSKGKTKYRYYTSRALLKDGNKDGGFRIPAADLETIVIDNLAAKLRDGTWVTSVLGINGNVSDILENAKALAVDLERQRLQNTGLLAKLLTKIIMYKQSLRLILSAGALGDHLSGTDTGNEGSVRSKTRPDDRKPHEIVIPSHLLRCGKQMRLTISNASLNSEPDSRLVHEILRARRWFDALSSGAVPTISALAKTEKCSAPYISRKISLAFLAPDIFETIVEGTQPSSLTQERLKQACPLPANWDDQRALLLS